MTVSLLDGHCELSVATVAEKHCTVHLVANDQSFIWTVDVAKRLVLGVFQLGGQLGPHFRASHLKAASGISAVAEAKSQSDSRNN